MRSHDHHEEPHQPTTEELEKKVAGMAKVVDLLLENIEKTVERLKKLGLDDEDALRAAANLFEVDLAFGGHGH